MENDIILHPENQPSQDIALHDDAVIALAEKAERRIDAVKKIKQLSLKVTNELDWVKVGDEPYMQASAAEKIAALVSMSWTIDEPVYEEYPDGHFMYTYTGEFHVAGKSIKAVGTRSSRDKFFMKYDHITGENGEEQRMPKPTSSISKGDVKKSAYTNLINNGIKRSLGLRNMTIKDLEAAGLDVSKIKGYGFKRTEMSDEGKGQADQIKSMMTEMYGSDYGQQLANITENVDKTGKKWAGIKTIDGCSEKKLPIVYRQVKAVYEKFKKNDSGYTTADDIKLVGNKSTEFKGAKEAIEKATDKDRIDEIMSSFSLTFNASAIKDLTAIANKKKKELAPF